MVLWVSQTKATGEPLPINESNIRRLLFEELDPKPDKRGVYNLNGEQIVFDDDDIRSLSQTGIYGFILSRTMEPGLRTPYWKVAAVLADPPK